MIPTLKNILTILSNKVDKVSGKGLSTNDFTDVYKSKLDEMGEGGVGSAITIKRWGGDV